MEYLDGDFLGDYCFAFSGSGAGGSSGGGGGSAVVDGG